MVLSGSSGGFLMAHRWLKGVWLPYVYRGEPFSTYILLYSPVTKWRGRKIFFDVVFIPSTQLLSNKEVRVIPQVPYTNTYYISPIRVISLRIPEVRLRGLRIVRRNTENSYVCGLVKEVLWKYTVGDLIGMGRPLHTRIDYAVYMYPVPRFPGGLYGLVFFEEDGLFTSLDDYILPPLLEAQEEDRSRIQIYVVKVGDIQEFLLVIVKRGMIWELYEGVRRRPLSL